jgi:hypothetical protein
MGLCHTKFYFLSEVPVLKKNACMYVHTYIIYNYIYIYVHAQTRVYITFLKLDVIPGCVCVRTCTLYLKKYMDLLKYGDLWKYNIKHVWKI